MTRKITINGQEFDAPWTGKTRDGRDAEVWRSDGKGEYPLIGAVGPEAWSFESWAADGRCNLNLPSCGADIILPPSIADQWTEALRPVWDLFPWASYVAKDPGGEVALFTHAPALSGASWALQRGDYSYLPTFSALEGIAIPWRESLRRRPEAAR